MKILLLIVGFIFTLNVGATESAGQAEKVLSFKLWKQQQETEAQNRVVRLSNNLLLLKSERYNPKNILPEVAAASKDEGQNLTPEQTAQLLNESEQQLQEALERLEFVKDLTINHYFLVYLKPYRSQPLVLQAVAKSMNESEVATLLSTLLNVQPDEAPVISATKDAPPVAITESTKDGASQL